MSTNMEKQKEKMMTLLLNPATFEWLTLRAKNNGRARLREAATIIEAERRREARHSQSPIIAQC